VSTNHATAAVLTGVGATFELREYPVPDPEPGAIVVKVELAGICATDAHVYRGLWPDLHYPAVLGHENTGIVVALGEGVDGDWLGEPLAVGDRVVVMGGTCGNCANCVLGRGPCTAPETMPGYGFSGPADVSLLSGGFSEYLYLSHPYTRVFKTSLDARTAVLAEPMATALSAVARTRIELGSTVVVQGAGAIGLLTLACARLSGATRTILVGGPAHRLELARELGASAVIDIEAVPDPAERLRMVRALTPGGRGADVVFGCVGAAPALPEGLRFLAPHGTMVELGTALGGASGVIRPAPELVGPNVTLIGHWDTRPEHWVRSLEVLASAGLPFARLVSHQLPLDRIGEAIESLLGDYVLDGKGVIKAAIAP
jgi:L-iditol 2-dehydrogenase